MDVNAIVNTGKKGDEDDTRSKSGATSDSTYDRQPSAFENSFRAGRSIFSSPSSAFEAGNIEISKTDIFEPRSQRLASWLKERSKMGWPQLTYVVYSIDNR